MFWLLALCVVVYLLAKGMKAAPVKQEERVDQNQVFATSSLGEISISVGTPRTAAAPLRPIQSTQAGAMRWVPAGESVDVAGYRMPGGMIYVGSSRGTNAYEPALIDPALHVDRQNPSRSGDGMSYWPSYSQVPPQCRAAYLEWLSNGRGSGAYIGYVFLFFYGIERRVLVDGQDVASLRAEVKRLRDLYQANGSFNSYSTSFLAATAATNLVSKDERELREEFLDRARGSESALATLLAWYHERERGLPADVAAVVATCMESATRSVVTSRAADELDDLFAKRYVDRYPTGFMTQAAVRPYRVEYHPASAALRASQGSNIVIPNVLGRRAQFNPIVTIWNECIADLKKFSTASRKNGPQGGLTAETWAALPDDLRAEYDHPDQDRWDTAFAKAAPCEPGALFRAAELASVARLTTEGKYTTAQLKRIAAMANAVGYALEPDPRSIPVSGAPETRLVVWRSRAPEPPEPAVWQPVAAVLRLAMEVVMADGEPNQPGLEKAMELVERLFSLDERLRERLRALRGLLLLEPGRSAALTRKLVNSHEPLQLESLGRLLVAISAADGILTGAEHKVLKALYKSLGLEREQLDAAVTTLGIRLDADEPVVIKTGKRGRAGTPIPPPPDEPVVARLNPAVVESVLRDTHEVSVLLAAVFEAEETAESDVQLPSPASAVGTLAPTARTTVPRPLAIAEAALEGLDAKYWALLSELIEQSEWSNSEARDLAQRHRVLPSAALDAINAWSDEKCGDFLVTDNGGWIINTDLIRSVRA